MAGYALFLVKRVVTGRPAQVRTRMLRDFVRAGVRRLREGRDDCSPAHDGPVGHVDIGPAGRIGGAPALGNDNVAETQEVVLENESRLARRT
jgi:hypothetical protein